MAKGSPHWRLTIWPFPILRRGLFFFQNLWYSIRVGLAMRFIEAKKVRPGDIILFSTDEVSAIPVRVIGVAQKQEGELTIRAKWESAGDAFTEVARCPESDRCLLIRRPKGKPKEKKKKK